MPQGDAARVAAKQESKILALCPNLIMHVTCSRYDDDTPRTPGWIVIRAFRGCWEVVCKEPDSCLSLSVADANLDDALVLAETLLGDPAAPWQQDPYLQRNSKQKKPNSR